MAGGASANRFRCTSRNAPAAQPNTNPATDGKVRPARRRARATSSVSPRLPARVARSITSWVVFVVSTAAEGDPGKRKSHQRILCRHRGHSQHARQHRKRAVGIRQGGRTLRQTRGSPPAGRVHDQQCAPRPTSIVSSSKRHRSRAQHSDEHTGTESSGPIWLKFPVM